MSGPLSYWCDHCGSPSPTPRCRQCGSDAFPTEKEDEPVIPPDPEGDPEEDGLLV